MSSVFIFEGSSSIRKQDAHQRDLFWSPQAVSAKLEDFSECDVTICSSSLVCQFRLVASQDNAAHILSLIVTG